MPTQCQPKFRQRGGGLDPGIDMPLAADVDLGAARPVSVSNLARETQDIFEDLKDQVAARPPEKDAGADHELNGLQLRTRTAQAAKLQADDEARRASAAVGAAAAGRAAVILALFEQCRSDESSPFQADSSAGQTGSWKSSGVAAGGCSTVVHSRPVRTAVCVVRVENRGPAGILITVTTTLDIAASSRGEARSVASYEEALSLVASFLRESVSRENSGHNVP